jgi:hypothetical protein
MHHEPAHGGSPPTERLAGPPARSRKTAQADPRTPPTPASEARHRQAPGRVLRQRPSPTLGMRSRSATGASSEGGCDHRQVTDVWLLALARHNKGARQLDRCIPVGAGADRGLGMTGLRLGAEGPGGTPTPVRASCRPAPGTIPWASGCARQSKVTQPAVAGRSSRPTLRA